MTSGRQLLNLEPLNCPGLHHRLLAMFCSMPIRLFAALSLSFLGSVHCASAEDEAPGTFFPEPQTTFMGARNPKLNIDFHYKTLSGDLWTAKAGHVSDGATIPRVLWAIVGPPWTGPHRKPAIIHDYYCDIRTRTPEEVHAVFYEGLLRSGVSKEKSFVMYQAVKWFAEPWVVKSSQVCSDATGAALDDCIVNYRSEVPATTEKDWSEGAINSFLEEMNRMGYEDVTKLVFDEIATK